MGKHCIVEYTCEKCGTRFLGRRQRFQRFCTRRCAGNGARGPNPHAYRQKAGLYQYVPRNIGQTGEVTYRFVGGKYTKLMHETRDKLLRENPELKKVAQRSYRCMQPWR